MSTIMLIDDDPVRLHCLEELLAQSQFALIARQTVDEALSEIARGTHVDLVIMDQMMSGMDGIQFLSRLRQLHPCLPAVMLTGQGTLEGYMKTKCLGAVDYVLKPVRARELVCIITAALGEINDLSGNVPNKPDESGYDGRIKGISYFTPP